METKTILLLISKNPGLRKGFGLILRRNRRKTYELISEILMEKSSQRNKRQSGDALKLIDMWSAQCGECFKWRTIPTVEEYEEIRSKFAEDPFICSKKAGVSCDDPADIEYNNSRTWLMDKPNIPKTPVGFKRRIVVRRDFSKLDCYYDAPNGRVLRASTQVGKFLSNHPEYKNVSASNFSFTRPKIMEDTLPPPPSLAEKV